jgi:hypothetical protein
MIDVYRYDHGDPSRVSSPALGTALLTRLGGLPLRLHTQLACLSQLFTAATYYADRPEWWRAHAQQYGYPFFAANLCRSLLMAPLTTQRPRDLDANQMLSPVETLIATREAHFPARTVAAELNSGCIFADNRPPELADLRVIKAMAGEWQLAMVELQRQLRFSIKAKIHGTHIVRNVHICKRGRDQ